MSIHNEKGEVLKAGCVVIDDGKVLLVTNRYDGMWGLPKGHIESGESAIAAATRETYEETGRYVVALAELSDRHYTSNHTGRAVHSRFWLARLDEQFELTATGEETSDWLPIDEALQILSEPNVALVQEALGMLVLE